MAWQTKVAKLQEKHGIDWDTARALYKSIQNGVSELEALSSLTGNSKGLASIAQVVGELKTQEITPVVSLVQAAENLVLAVGGDLGKAKAALAAYESFHALHGSNGQGVAAAPLPLTNLVPAAKAS